MVIVSIEARQVRTSVAQTGSFECSDPLINRNSYPIVAWDVYLESGDPRILERHYSGIEALVRFACPASFEPLLDPGPWVRRVPLKAGSAVVFTEALTHGTLPWTAEHERRALFYRCTPGHMAFVGRYREDGREHPGGAYPQPSHAATDDWTSSERRMLEPPYAWERPDPISTED